MRPLPLRSSRQSHPLLRRLQNLTHAFLALTLTVIVNSPVSQAVASQSATDAVIVIIGDSLTQGYGVLEEEAYPQQVERILSERLKTNRLRVINAGISGAVTAEVDKKVRWYLKSKPVLILLALGANDGMKGTPTAVIRSNLERAIDLAKENKVKVGLLGIKMFTNLGSQYVTEFDSIYPALAKNKSVPLMPFLLDGVALKKELNQSDMRHPNAKGHRLMAEAVARFIETMLLCPAATSSDSNCIKVDKLQPTTRTK